MTIDELRKKLINGKIQIPYSGEIVGSGELQNYYGKMVPYEIKHGWDIKAAADCDHLWTEHRIKIIESVEKQNISDEEKNRALKKYLGQHSHWDWLNKSVFYKTNEYEWFFLISENKPQGACLIYHPKESKFDNLDIFYIEFIAVAPWNKDSPVNKRIFKGVGTKLIECAWFYATNNLKLVDGFSLHALSQAEKYYESLGMVNFPKEDKPGLKYYEIPRNTFGCKGGSNG